MGEQWAIIGGGIHGVHLAVRLLGEAKVARECLQIVDPSPQLLSAWRRCTENTGMRFLRSPAVHNLDLDPWALFRYAKMRGQRDTAFAPPYERPSFSLFMDHCDDIIDRYRLNELHVQSSAKRVELLCDHARVHLGNGDHLDVQHVILAMGATRQPRWPSWAKKQRRRGARIQHVFEPGFDLVPDQWPDRVAVIGGGITACQVALRLATLGRTVDLVSRHEPRAHQFDSDPGWLGPKFMHRYSKIDDLRKRRRLIVEARHVGSVPPDILRAVEQAVKDQRVRVHVSDCAGHAVDDGVLLELDDGHLAVDGVLLATGFETERPGGALVDELVESGALPCAGCGYPIVDRNLRWHPRVFVTGPLAELEIGPVSRNIAGARRAAERIVQTARVR